VIVLLSALFFISQSNPNLIPTLPINFLNHTDISTPIKYTIQPTVTTTTASSNRTLLLVNSTTTLYSTFIGIDKIKDPNHLLKAFERSVVDFIPLLPVAGDIKMGLIDYILKIVGAIIFGLIIIALRRRFERKYYH